MDSISPEIVVSVAPPPDTFTVCVPLSCIPYRTEYPVMSQLRWLQFTAPHWTVMLEEVTSDTLTEVGAANGAGRKIIQIRREKKDALTSCHCGGCAAVFSTSPITQHCSHIGVLSAPLQARHCVHCLTSSNISDVIRQRETLSVLSVGVGDGVAISCHFIYQCP